LFTGRVIYYIIDDRCSNNRCRGGIRLAHFETPKTMACVTKRQDRFRTARDVFRVEANKLYTTRIITVAASLQLQRMEWLVRVRATNRFFCNNSLVTRAKDDIPMYNAVQVYHRRRCRMCRYPTLLTNRRINVCLRSTYLLPTHIRGMHEATHTRFFFSENVVIQNLIFEIYLNTVYSKFLGFLYYTKNVLWSSKLLYLSNYELPFV
jgi:hypothetical protein